MDKMSGFHNIDDEMNWEILKMSDGNFEAASEFVRERNINREKQTQKDRSL